jgi:hypothetical protein
MPNWKFIFTVVIEADDEEEARLYAQMKVASDIADEECEKLDD